MRQCTWVWSVVLLVVANLGAGCAGCNERTQPGEAEVATAKIEEELERANRLAADRSQLQIEGYIRRNGIEGMQKMANGLYVKVEGKAQCKQFVEGERAKVAYRLELLDGTLIWEIDSTRAESLTLGARDRTAGLDMLITAMAPGQHGVGLIPSHLGYGLSGDGSKVPPHASLMYKVTWVRRLP